MALLSLAGIPLTAGFVGKFYLVEAGAGASLWALIVVLVLTSTIGLYYYTRVVVAMYVQGPEGEASQPRALASAGLVLAALTVLLVVAGVYPSPLIRLIESAVSSLP